MEPTKKSNGALVGSIIIIVILVLGGLYFWMSKQDQAALNENLNIGRENSELEDNQSAAAVQSLNQLEAEISAEQQSDFAASANNVN